MLGCIEPIENRCFYNRACSGTSKPLDNVPSLGSSGVPGKSRKCGLDRCVINLHPCLCEYPYWEHRAGFLDEGMIWDDNRVATRDLARSCAFERAKIRESVVPNDQAPGRIRIVRPLSSANSRTSHSSSSSSSAVKSMVV